MSPRTTAARFVAALAFLSVVAVASSPARADLARRKLLPPAKSTGRLAIAFGGGIGWSSLSRYHDGVDSWLTALGEVAPDARFSGSPTGGGVTSAEVSLRYYSPWYTFVHLGYSMLLNTGSARVTSGSVEGTVANQNILLELQVMVGGCHLLWDRLYLHAGLGASLIFFGRSYWQWEHGELSDFEVNRGGGVIAVAGADLIVWRQVAIGLELRGRYVRTGELSLQGPALPPLQPVSELDMSGVGLLTLVRVFVW